MFFRAVLFVGRGRPAGLTETFPRTTPSSMPSRSRHFAAGVQRRRVDAGLPALEARLAMYRRDVFSRHIHEQWCVGVVLSGATRLWRAGTHENLTAGSVVCLRPGEAHACNPVSDGRFASLMFFLDPEAAALACGRGTPGFAWSTKHDVVLARRLARFYREMNASVSPLEKQVSFCQVFGPFWRPLQVSDPRHECGLVETLRDYLRDNYRHGVSLAALAALVGRSPAHVLRLFKRGTGLPPHAYQNHVRVEQAKILLSRGEPAAQVAQAVGFADQSHLIRTFLAHVGTTPRRYCLSRPA